MKQTSDVAFEVTQDIYALAGAVDKLNERYDNRHISEQVYYKKLYVKACEVACLETVVETLKDKGYKFAKYAKELSILSAISEEINSNLDLKNMNSVNFLDMKNLMHLMKKYKSILPADNFEEEFSEEI